ncbi:MAG: hypothetical protein ACON5F_00705 [Jejuia sp.]
MSYKRPKTYYFKNLLISILCSMMMLCCKTAKPAVASKVDEIKDKPERIVFLNYAIKKDANGNKNIRLLTSKKVEGSLKSHRTLVDGEGNSEDLICSQLNGEASIVSQTLIRNPLHKTLEYLDDSKNFKAIAMELDSSEFTVRLQLYPETQSISITDVSEQSDPYILTKVTEL